MGLGEGSACAPPTHGPPTEQPFQARCPHRRSRAPAPPRSLGVDPLGLSPARRSSSSSNGRLPVGGCTPLPWDVKGHVLHWAVPAPVLSTGHSRLLTRSPTHLGVLILDKEEQIRQPAPSI